MILSLENRHATRNAPHIFNRLDGKSSVLETMRHSKTKEHITAKQTRCDHGRSSAEIEGIEVSEDEEDDDAEEEYESDVVRGKGMKEDSDVSC